MLAAGGPAERRADRRRAADDAEHAGDLFTFKVGTALAPARPQGPIMTDSAWGHPSFWLVMAGGYLVASGLGALLAASRYCSLGAVSDLILLEDSHRLRMWLAAAGSALLGSAALEAYAGLDFSATLVRYASPHFAWMRYVSGGLLFGIGMQLASGCASRQLLRLGGGSLKAATVLAAAGVVAAWLIDGGGLARHLAPLLDVGAVEFQGPSRLANLLALRPGPLAPAALAAGIGGMLLLAAAGRRGSRLSRLEWLAGLGLGAAVSAGWFLTGLTPGETWQEDMAFLPALPRGVGTQSYTFIAPLADLLAAVRGRGALTFGLCGALGLVTGSALWHWRNGRLRLERHRRPRDFLRSIVGGALLGGGGVLALGCSTGQGVTGLSTLALGSLLATAATVGGAALAVFIEYRIVQP